MDEVLDVVLGAEFEEEPELAELDEVEVDVVFELGDDEFDAGPGLELEEELEEELELVLDTVLDPVLDPEFESKLELVDLLELSLPLLVEAVFELVLLLEF